MTTTLYNCPNCKQHDGAHLPHCRLAPKPPAAPRILADADGFRAGYDSATEAMHGLAVLLLEPITRYGCHRYTGEATCRDANSGHTRDGDDGATRWCSACVALDTLDRLGPAANLNPATGRTPAHDRKETPMAAQPTDRIGIDARPAVDGEQIRQDDLLRRVHDLAMFRDGDPSDQLTLEGARRLFDDLAEARQILLDRRELLDSFEAVVRERLRHAAAYDPSMQPAAEPSHH